VPVAHLVLAAQHRLGPRQIARLAAKALLAKVVGHTAGRNAVQPGRQCLQVALQLTNGNREAVAAQRTAAQLA
jgi:hypothetical protein